MVSKREVISGNINELEQEVDSTETRVDFLESGIETSALITDAEQKFAKIVAGGSDDICKFWKVRHHPMMSSVGNGDHAEGDDFEQKFVQDRLMVDPKFTIVSSMASDAQSYLTNTYYIEQNEQLQFRIKKGENFFWIGTFRNTDKASVWRVYVDGVNANSYGLVDQNGAAVPSSFSCNGALAYGLNFQFYGLDGEEHIITIKNENGSALEMPLNYIDVGHRPVDYAIDHTMRINAGTASVNGVSTNFPEGTFSFARPTEGLANGYTGMIKVNQVGQCTAVNGLSPASTQVKPQYLIPFSSGPVTSLPVKNHYAFPNNGICLYQDATGLTYLFSYGGKTDPSPANQTLSNIIWQRQPVEDYTPLVTPAGTKRISTITNTNAGNSVNLDVIGAAKKVTLWAARPLLGHYFWFKVTDGVNVQVDPGGGSTATEGHMVAILSADTADQVAGKLQAVIDALPEFTATVLANVVTVTNASAGAVTATANTATGITVATPTAGVNPVMAANSWRGDSRIEYWAKAPIQITSSNNKVDFQITVNGTTSSHTATLANGFYSADLIPLEKAFKDAMSAEKSIRGNYFLEYNKDSQFWSIGVDGDEQANISFLFKTGANAANSLGALLGFQDDLAQNIDLTTKKSYVAPLPRQHLAQRVFVPDMNFRSTEHPSIKYSWALSAQVTIPEADQLLVDLGLPSYRRQASAGNIFYIYPDEDACGMTLTFMREDLSVYITYQIDDGDVVYLAQHDRPVDSANPTKGTAINSFISFPKGSKKIAVRPEYNAWFQTESTTTYVTFFGYRQWFTKPPWETLSLTEKILKTVEVAPLRLFGTNYSHITDLYQPQGSNDNIDTMVESGTKEVTNLTVVNAGAFYNVVGAAKNFTLYAAPRPSVTGEAHYFWLKCTDGVGQTDPGIAGIGHEVQILTGDSAVVIATKIAAVVNSLTTKFTAEIRNAATAVITVKNVFDGAVTNAVNGALTAALTIAVENEGTLHWAQTTHTDFWSARSRDTAIYGAALDVTFTLAADGGGIGIMTTDSTATSQQYEFYLASGTTINEATDLIEVQSTDAAAALYDVYRFMHLGLKAGQYTLRLRNSHAQTIYQQAIFIVDGVHPQLNVSTHTDLANTGQGISYPLNVRRRNFQRYGILRQPSWLTEGLARTGLVCMADYFVATHNILNYDDAATVGSNQSAQYWNTMYTQMTGSYFQLPFIGRSVCALYQNYTAYTTTITPTIDGVASSIISQREVTKGSTTSSTTRNAGVGARIFMKDLERACTFDSGFQFNVTGSGSTQGIRPHQKAILVDSSGNREEVFINTVTTDTNFTIKKGLSVIAAGDVVKILFHGFHSVKLTANDAIYHSISAIEYEPLPLEWSILEDRVSTVTFQEIKELNYNYATSLGAGSGTTYTFEFPFHSDGEQGNALTSEMEIYMRTLGGGASLMYRGLKQVSVWNNDSAGTRTVSTFLNVRSRRNIPLRSSGLVRG